MKKQAKARESELDRINRKAKADFDRYMDEYPESPEFEMCEVAKRVYWAVGELVQMIDPAIPRDETSAIAKAVKNYRNWVQRQERDADALIELAILNPGLAREKHDQWKSELAGESAAYDELVTEIHTLGKSEHTPEFDRLRTNLQKAESAFLEEVCKYLDGKPKTENDRLGCVLTGVEFLVGKKRERDAKMAECGRKGAKVLRQMHRENPDQEREKLLKDAVDILNDWDRRYPNRIAEHDLAHSDAAAIRLVALKHSHKDKNGKIVYEVLSPAAIKKALQRRRKECRGKYDRAGLKKRCKKRST